ncbi:rCG57270 [Rattus norvegicus]|uniref:RCG57270 n=1 Tax=Rattus norvegicus TaxID=10116 RepID=A6JP65_RAT|nr:rCG57270 [Rattus norvegicus]
MTHAQHLPHLVKFYPSPEGQLCPELYKSAYFAWPCSS